MRLHVEPRPRAARASLPPGLLRFLWVRLAGTTAAQMLLVALAWQMYDLTGSAWDLGLVGPAAVRCPALLLALPAGHVVDRLAPRAHRGRRAWRCRRLSSALLLARQRRAAAASRELLLGAVGACSARCAPSRCRRSRR
ncbi:MAG: hypothetical protein MZW92_40170 [Comamonadaceae bacterium]|nr:hypothetical protein [Comamonadaceae bacterium]